MPHTSVSRFDQEQHLIRRLSRWRKLRAIWRDTRVLLREFQESLLIFLIIWLTGAISFMVLWNFAHDASNQINYLESLYDILTMIFFQPSLEFPDKWYLDVYFFVMPLMGVVILARGMADFVSLLFNRNLRQSQWEEAVASTFNNHIIVCGLGHVGLRVVKELILLNEDIVVIELDEDSPRFAEMRKFDIPIIIGDGRIADNLLKAGLEQASAIIICTNDDLMNLQIASRIREINPDIRLVMRMFDERFAHSIADQFNIHSVYSASTLAAPAFAGAAAGSEILHTFKVEHSTLVMGRIEVMEGGRLDGATIRDIEEAYDLSIVLHHSQTGINVTPESDIQLHVGDVIAVVGELTNMRQLIHRWNHENKR